MEETKPKEKKTEYGKWIMLGVIGVLVIGIALMLFGFLIPFFSARSTMPAGGDFILEQQSEGNLRLSWPEADRADYYCVEVLVPASSEEEQPKLVYKDYIEGTNSCLLPQLPAEMDLTLRIRSVVEYHTLGGEKIRYGDAAMEVTTVYTAPTIADFEWKADPDTKTIRVNFSTQGGNHARFYLLDGDGNVTETSYPEGNELVLSFGENGDYPMPEYGETYHFAFDAYREDPGVRFYGCRSAEMTVTRDDLLGRELNLTCVDKGNNVYTFTWDETKGDYYQVQVFDSNSRLWKTVHEVEGDESRSYTTGHLTIFSKFGYRVVAVGGQTMEGSEYAAVSEEITVTTKESPIFATIWPTKELQAYKDTAQTEEAGKVATGTACCVLEEKDGMFGIRLDGETVYIDSNYCMINLPEYLGSLCSYQITNSDSSIYLVHEFEIPKVTGVVTKGYENVRLSDGEYLVPLLYPTAKKLLTAAQDAISQGYRLKIYDSFRPYVATRQIYDLTNSILDQEIPKKTYTGVSVSKLNLPKAETKDDGTESLTYRMVMCGSSYGLNYFLAKGGSMHNLGIALDLTLEDLYTGKEIAMQTSIHDLSQYSVLSRNNSAAKTLAQIMKGAGFGDLISEWWHFQDNEAKSQLAPSNVTNGVNASCWMADDHGWKYRTVKGTYYTGETVTIDGVEYTFDESGYVINS